MGSLKHQGITYHGTGYAIAKWLEVVCHWQQVVDMTWEWEQLNLQARVN